MPTIATVLADIERLVPSSGAAGWDPGGLQLGDPAARVSTVGVCHEVTESVVEEVERLLPGLLLTYHPLLFRPTRTLVAGRSPSGRAFRLVRAGVALTVAHTSFDVVEGGAADALASELGLEDPVPFGPVEPAGTVKVVTFLPADQVETVAEAMTRAGAGTIGGYSGCSFRSTGVGAFSAGPGTEPAVGSAGDNRVDEVRLEMVAPEGRRDAVVAALVAAHPYEEPAYDLYSSMSNAGFIGRAGRYDGTTSELVEVVRERLGGVGLRVSGDTGGSRPMVAVVPGSGSSLIGAARGAGADVVVTGDVDHHRVVSAVDAGLCVVDPGHAPTERPGMRALAALLGALDGVDVVDLTDRDPTPWR